MASFVAPYLFNITLQTLVPRFQAGFVALICYKRWCHNSRPDSWHLIFDDITHVGATLSGRICGTRFLQ